MKASNLRVGMHVKMSDPSIIKVLTTCSDNSSTGNNFWFEGEIVDLNGSTPNEWNYVGYKSEFNVDFAEPVNR